MSLLRLLGVNSTSQQSSVAAAKAKEPSTTSADHKQFGLENFGNTCYINAVFQALYFCSPFRDLVIATVDDSVSNELLPQAHSPQPPVPVQGAVSPMSTKTMWSARTGLKRRDSSQVEADNTNTVNVPAAPPIPADPPSLFSALRSLFIYIAQNPQDNGKVPPDAFVKKVKDDNEAFRNNNHQDAHELLNFLLNKVVEDLEAAAKTDTSSRHLRTIVDGTLTETLTSIQTTPKKTLVHALFEGTLTSETRCLTCETVSSRDESFLDLSIDIEPNSSVTSCLRQFSASEMLCQRNKFSCDSCSGLQEAEKRMKVKRLPNILALHLKRFKYQEEAQKFIKLSYRVAFPLELRLFNTVDDAENPDRLYKLFAIVVHIGGGPHHGHYTSIVKSRGSWFLFDDDGVEPVKESDIPKYFGESNVGAGYVLFYQADDLDYVSVGLPPPLPFPSAYTKEKQKDEDVNLPAGTETSYISGLQTSPSAPVLKDDATIGNQVTLPMRLDTSVSSSLSNDIAPVPSSPTREVTGQKLRHSKSDRLLHRRSSTAHDTAPPLPPLPKVTSNGDIGPTDNEHDHEKEENRRSWRFGRSRTVKKKQKDSSTSVSVASQESPIVSAHSRARTTSTIGKSPMQVDLQNSHSFGQMHDQAGLSPQSPTRGLPISPDITTESLNSPHVGVASSNLPSVSHLHDTGEAEIASSSKQTYLSPNLEATTSSASQEPRIKASLQPTPSVPPPTEQTSPKKASRKMSLSSMPLRLGLIGRKERES